MIENNDISILIEVRDKKAYLNGVDRKEKKLSNQEIFDILAEILASNMENKNIQNG